MRVPGVTVAVPTLDRADCLIDTLEDLGGQSFSPLEILVVDQSAFPDSRIIAYVRRCSDQIAYYNVSFRGLPNARNFAWQKAKYPLIVFVDDDIRCGPCFVQEHVNGFTNERIGAVTGKLDERGSELYPSWKLPTYNYWTATPARIYVADGFFEIDHFPGCNFSVRKDVIEKMGGFDERLNYGAALYEETEFALRLRRQGYGIMYNSKAMLKHLANKNGGCRVPDIKKYCNALVHNRCILIFRYSKWYQTIIALFRLMLLVAAYARAYKKISIFYACFSEARQGYGDARKGPQVTVYE